MTQRRFLNFGTTADASKTKSIVQQLFNAQLLRGDTPFFSSSPPDQLLIQPHSVVFDNGLVLDETEVQAITIATTFSSADFTIFYEHVDVDQIGGSAAELKTSPGLLTSITNGVIIGWVVYPGGSVALDNSMLFPNFEARLLASRRFDEHVRLPADATTIVQASTITTSLAASIMRSIGQIVPPDPHQITIPDLPVSRLVAIEANQKIRVYSHDDSAEMTRVAAAPATGEFSLNEVVGVFTFDSVDEGKIVDISDMTYGGSFEHSKNSSTTDAAVEDTIYSFPVTDILIKTIQVEYVILSGYTLDLIEVFDINGNAGVVLSRKEEPTTPDGTISRLTIRLLEGTYFGSEGEQFTIRLRKSLAASGEGLLLRVRASASDLPF